MPDRELPRGRPTRYGIALVALVALGPFAGFAERNAAQIKQSWRLLAYAVVVALLCVGALAVVVRRWRRGDADRVAVAVAAVVASFLNFSVLFNPNEIDRSKLLASYVVWALLTIVVARLAYLVGRSPSVRTGVAVFAAMLLVLPTAGYLLADAEDTPVLPVERPGDLVVPAERPNVYWIILDSYARPDVMSSIVGIDDSDYVAALEDRGFQVSQTSRTSYIRTHQSLSSTLQMGYPLEPGHDITDDFGVLGPVVVGRSNTVARLEALGYEIAYGSAGAVEWTKCRDDLVDVCLPLARPFPPTGELEQTLLDLTPFGALRLPVPYSDPVRFAEAVRDEQRGLDEPFFAYQHVLAPHFPFRYREDCSVRETPTSELRMTDEEQLQAYREQIPCVRDLVVRAVDRIVEDDPGAVILVQSDHGSEVRFTWDDHPDDWTAEQLTERFGAFNAMRLPADCDVDIEGAALVNTFRIVFACIEGREPDLLPYRAFGHPFFGVADLEEIDLDRFDG
jgi:hypothetical protein